ncbi:hypothetical protein Fcan01_25958 [Folsomia candida]|uniref:Uncharacterized protein n=2 Tax=Folsomia candida TaxID=158441 RepID=A0A226D3H9_FOLCA|nr:hypothetical protein Fcan01_25958 [Folsomia candida]
MSWILQSSDEVLNFNIVIIGFAVPLEISVSELMKATLSPKKIHNIFWLWVVSSIALTSFYKDVFTTEIILPCKRSLTWAHTYELEEHGFQFFFPIPPHEKIFLEIYANGTPFEYIRNLEFSRALAAAREYVGKSFRLLGHKRFAVALYASEGDTGIPRIWKGLHYKWPADIYSNLSSCGKFAYVDARENIKRIIPFLNDNTDGTVFMAGSDEDFLLMRYSIQLRQRSKSNFVANKVNSLQVSGIYKWWEDWFAKLRPNKLFTYYANWTRPTVSALEKLDFSSKFATTLRVWGICCGICVAGGTVEILLHLYTTYLNREPMKIVRKVVRSVVSGLR